MLRYFFLGDPLPPPPKRRENVVPFCRRTESARTRCLLERRGRVSFQLISHGTDDDGPGPTPRGTRTAAAGNGHLLARPPIYIYTYMYLYGRLDGGHHHQLDAFADYSAAAAATPSPSSTVAGAPLKIHFDCRSMASFGPAVDGAITPKAPGRTHLKAAVYTRATISRPQTRALARQIGDTRRRLSIYVYMYCSM